MENLADLRAILFETIKDVREKKIDVDTAKAVNDLAKTINDQANIIVKAAENFRNVDHNGLFSAPQLLGPGKEVDHE